MSKSLTSPQDDAASPIGPGPLRSFWRWLTEPPASLPEHERRRSRFLAQILLSLNLFTLAGFVAFLASNPVNEMHLAPFFAAAAGDYVAFTAAYVLNRRGRYLVGAALAVGALSSSLWVMVVIYWSHFEIVNAILLYVIICVLLSSILFSLRAAAAIAAAHLILGVVMLALIPREATIVVGDQLLFITFAVAMIMAATAFRRQDEAKIEYQTRALAASEEKYRRIIETAQEGIWMLDADARTTFVNRRMTEMLGYAEEELLGRALYDFLSEAIRPEAETYFRRRQQGISERHDFRFRRKDGSELWAIVSTSPLVDDDGRFTGALGLITDITERKEAEEALRVVNNELTRWVNELEQRTREIGLLNQLGELLQSCLTYQEAYDVISGLGCRLFPDEDGVLYVISASRNWVEVAATWGIAQTELSERIFGPDDCWALRRGRLHLADGSHGAPACVHLAGAAPGVYACVPLMAQGEAVGVLTLRGAATEKMSDARQQLARTAADAMALALANLKLRETLRHQSIRDPLTGLFNRRYLEETLEREVRRAGRNQRPLGIIVLDIDHFKNFNDTFGHAAGDTVLRELGELLRSRIRAEDIPCRFGGEEFVMILPESPLEATRQRAEAIRKEVKRLRADHAGQPLGAITISAGVAAFPEHGVSGDVLMRAADDALYRAKHEGRDRVKLAGPTA